MKFVVREQRRGRLRRRQVRVALVADNGQELLGSEGYNNLGDALTMVQDVIDGVRFGLVPEVEVDKRLTSG